jgi:hypothetical protein
MATNTQLKMQKKMLPFYHCQWHCSPLTYTLLNSHIELWAIACGGMQHALLFSSFVIYNVRTDFLVQKGRSMPVIGRFLHE